jgi:CMP-N-acetylneuraminic acid synthetase
MRDISGYTPDPHSLKSDKRVAAGHAARQNQVYKEIRSYLIEAHTLRNPGTTPRRAAADVEEYLDRFLGTEDRSVSSIAELRAALLAVLITAKDIRTLPVEP